jgi:hypothetical protein
MWQDCLKNEPTDAPMLALLAYPLILNFGLNGYLFLIVCFAFVLFMSSMLIVNELDPQVPIEYVLILFLILNSVASPLTILKTGAAAQFCAVSVLSFALLFFLKTESYERIAGIVVLVGITFFIHSYIAGLFGLVFISAYLCEHLLDDKKKAFALALTCGAFIIWVAAAAGMYFPRVASVLLIFILPLTSLTHRTFPLWAIILFMMLFFYPQVISVDEYKYGGNEIREQILNESLVFHDWTANFSGNLTPAQAISMCRYAEAREAYGCLYNGTEIS